VTRGLRPSLFIAAFAGLVGCGSAVPNRATGAETSLFSRPWTWTDDHGQAVTLSRWGGAPQVVTMFFRGCDLRCPLTLAKLHDVEAAFSRVGQPVQFVLVTLDPRNDTPERLADFKAARHLGETWHLLAGNNSDTQELGKLLGIHRTYDDLHIDHDVRIALIDADGRIVQMFEGWHFDEGVMPRLTTQRSGRMPEGFGRDTTVAPALAAGGERTP
jgi:protein SCO1/2